MSQLEVQQVSVAYAENIVIQYLDMDLEAGKLGCLIGPSGCGKSTLLRAIAGFEPVREGSIRLGGREISRPGKTLPPERRRIGMVFQDFALFPHLSIEDNVAFGLRGWSSGKRRTRVEELLRLVGLADRANAHPHQLSGGQQQRIALARALAPKPEILLLDEPFSSLDAELREQLALDVRGWLQKEEMTGLMVTHDQGEALGIADHVGLLHQGRLLQWDTPYRIYHAPSHRFVAEFIGHSRFLPGELLEGQQVRTPFGCFARKVDGIHPESASGITCPVDQCGQMGRRVEVLLRPDDFLPSEEGTLRGKVVERRFRGAEYLYNVELADGNRIQCLAPSHFAYQPGEEIALLSTLQEVVVFDGERAVLE